MADATVGTDDEHSPIQYMASSYDEHSPIQIMVSSSSTAIHVASIPDTITSVLNDDRFKNELASLVDKQIAMKSVLPPSVNVRMYQSLLLQLRQKDKRLIRLVRLKPAFSRVTRLLKKSRS